MTTLSAFGDPARFEIALALIEDGEPRSRRPAQGGWSTGSVRLTVGAHVLTRHRRNGCDVEELEWYLFPLFDWLITNWRYLLHEQHYGWKTNTAAPAAAAVFLELRRFIDADDDEGASRYSQIHAWWSRHSLRSADASGLYPDIVVRRLDDDIEISWTARQPTFAPDGFRFYLEPGAVTLSVSDVAGPLWNALAWFIGTSSNLDHEDKLSLQDLKQRTTALAQLVDIELEKTFLPETLYHRVEQFRRKQGLEDSRIRLAAVPALASLDASVLMFGGIDPQIDDYDANQLIRLLTLRDNGGDSLALASLVDPTIGPPLSTPFEEGYDLAEQILEQFDLTKTDFVDIEGFIHELGIEIIVERLHTTTVRGVAIAGENYSPLIMTNEASGYNATRAGERFTLAHELCHILYDRTRACRISHASGPWASPGIEKRANAFAAMLLMPRSLLRRLMQLDNITDDSVHQAAKSMRVGARALLEHLYNMNLIDAFQREDLRAQLTAA